MSASTLPRSAAEHVRSAASTTGQKLHITSPSKTAAVRATAVRSAKASRDTVTGHPKASGSTFGSLVLVAVAMLLLLRRRRPSNSSPAPSDDSN